MPLDKIFDQSEEYSDVFHFNRKISVITPDFTTKDHSSQNGAESEEDKILMQVLLVLK